MSSTVEARRPPYDWAPYAQQLQHFRLAQGWSQQYLGLHAGVTRSVVCQYEQGSTEPSLSVLLLMLNALEVTPGEFFTLNPESPNGQ